MKYAMFRVVFMAALVLFSNKCAPLHELHSQADASIYILAVDWNEDGSRIAAVGLRSGSDNGYVLVLDSTTEQTLYSFQTPYGGFQAVDWSPDGRFIAVGGYDQTVKIIAVPSGEIAATLAGHRGVITSVDWNSEGTRLVSSSPVDQQVILWDAEKYELISSIEIGDPWTVSFSPDDRQIAMGGRFLIHSPAMPISSRLA